MLVVGLVAFLAILPTSATIFYGPIIVEITRAQDDRPNVGSESRRKDGTSSTLFIGDSYMQQYYPRIARMAKLSSRGAIVMSLPGCAPFQGVDRRSIHCSSFIDQEFARAKQKDIDRVVIAASWFGFSDRNDYYDLADARRAADRCLARQLDI